MLISSLTVYSIVTNTINSANSVMVCQSAQQPTWQVYYINLVIIGAVELPSN